MADDLMFRSPAALAALVRSGELSASELVRAEHGRLDINQGKRVQLLAYRVSPSANVLVVGVSTADRDSALASLQRLLFIGGPIALLIACAAGYIVAAKALDPRITATRPLSLFAYAQGDTSEAIAETHWDYLRRLEDWGFVVNPLSKRVRDEAEAEAVSWMSFIASTIHPARRIGPERWREVLRKAHHAVEL